MGLIVNKTLDLLTIGVYAQLGIEPAMHSAQPVHFGGPVSPGHGFILHSGDYREAGRSALARNSR